MKKISEYFGLVTLMVASFASVSMAQGTSQVTKFLCRFPTYDSFGTEEIKVANENILSNLENCDLDDSDYPIVYKCTLHGEEISLPTGYPDYSCTEYTYDKTYFCLKLDGDAIKLKQSDVDLLADGYTCFEDWFTELDVSYASAQVSSRNVSGGVLGFISENSASADKLVLESDIDFGEMGADGSCNRPFTALISSSIKTVDGDSHKIKNLCNTSGGFAQSPYGNGYDAAPVNINFKDITFETARVHGGVLAESWGGSDGSSVVSAVNVTVDGAVVTAASGTAGGLTGFLEPGSVLDGVTVSNVTVEGESSYDRVGGIAGAINADAYGYAYSTSIMKTRVMGTNSLKGKNAGGLIGYISHNADVTISNSKVSGVTVKGSYAGGMVGFIEPKASSVSVIFTSDTTDQSTVTAAGYESYSARDNLMESGVGAKAAFAGGLIGAAQTSRDYSGDVQHTLMMTIEDFLGTNLTINTDVAAADQPTGTDPKKVFLGGVAGYMFVSGDGMISRKMKVSSLSITNNEIDAESYMGGIYGQVTAKGTKGATNFAKDTVTSATLSKGAYAGGFIGHLYGADAYSGSSAVMEDSYFSGAINPSCGKRSAIGGFVGYFEAKKTDDSYVDINKSVVEADITENFGKCGTDDVAGIDSSSVGGLVGRTAENNRARIRNTYLKGNITYSAPDGLTTAWVGGILGSSESYGDRCIINDKTIIYSTYRITTDDVITGVGVCTEDEWHLGVPNWSASIGNESVKSFLNLRTSTGTSTGPFGYRNNHLYTSTWGDNDSYSILKDGSSVNGEVSQDVLKSDIAAAVFNTVDGVWTRSEAVNEGYPSFADDENLPIYTVVFDLSSAFSDYAAADDPDAATTPMPSEMQDLLDRYEPYEYYSYIVNDWSSSRSSYMRQGVVAYTNNKGQLPAALVADMKTVADNSYWVGKVGTTDYKLNSTETYSAPLVYTLTPKKTYQFVYRNCFYDGGMVCYSSDEGGFFLSAALDEVSDDGSNDWTLLPTFWNTIDNQYYDAVLLIKETDFTANVVNAAGEDAFDASNIIAGETIYTYGALIDYLVKGNVPSTEPLYFVYINSSTRSNAASAQLVVRSSGLYDKWVGNINYYNAGTDQILPQKLSYEKAAINDSKNPVYVPLTNNLSFDFVAPGYTYDGYKASFVIGGATPAKTDAPTYFAGKNEFQALINDSKYEAGWTTELLDAGTPLNMDSVAIGKGRLMESAAATLTSQLIIEPVLTKIPYTVTFNLDAFTDVYYGDDETETECAKGTAAEGACPKKYVINDVYFPRKIYGAVNVAGEKSYQKVQWRVNENDDNGISVLQLTVNNLREKTADELNSLTETEKLDYINKYIQSTADADGNYSFTMYGFAEANVKLASSMYLEMLGVASAYDKDDPSQNVKDFVLTDEADYHGHFEISQKYGAGVDDVSTHTSTWSRIMDMGSPNYKDWSHNILIPGANDTLYFDVKFVPDAGYDIEYISYETTASGYSAGPAPGKPENPFGYDNDTKKLVLNPYLVNMAAFYVKFISNDYNVSFTAPEEGMYITGDDWGRDWTSPQAYSAADINKDFPKIYALDKCYGWSPSVTPEELPDEWPFPATKLTEEVMKYLSLGTENTLVLEELVPCNPRTKSITVSSKFGTVTLSQVIGDGENVYPFKEGGYTRVPSTVEGIPFQIKIEPLESYVVKSITYSFRNQYNNLESTLLDYDPEYLPGIVVQGLHDSPSIDVEYYAPGSRFVKYDLGIGETDSAEVYFPEDALLTQTFTMEDANETKPWQPYRVGKHFKGWSLTPESDVVDIDLYSLIDADLISRLSMKENYPTTLYAVWDENFDGGQVMFDLEQGDVEHGSVKVYQEWDGKKIYHDISDAVTLVYKQEGESYLFGVEAIPDAGYENAGVSVVRLCADGLDAERCEGTTFTPDDNGIYSILAAWTSAVDVASTIRVSATFAKTAYNFAFNMGNAPSSVYKTSEWIDSKDNMQLDEVFPEGVARTDACFGGWAFADGESVGFSKLSGDDFFAALAAATPEKQTVPPADPDGEAGEIDVYNLYPVWTTTDCAPKTVKVASSNAPSSGKFVLTQGAIKLDVTAAGVTVPADAKMDVQFVVGAGASVDAAVTYDVALLDADGEPVNEGLNDSKLTPVDNVASYTFAGSVAVTDDELEVVSYNLSATVEYDEMTVVFDVNAGDEDVFYGSDWKKTATYSMDMAADELKLPKNIYRSYIRLLGWSFSTDEDANIYTAFDSDMVGEYIEAKAASADGSVTLFARWDESEGPQVYTVVNGMSEKGVLHLAQTVGTEEVPYVVEQGMQIPVAAETEFTVTYEPKPGYKVVSFKATDLQGVEIADAITTTIAADVVVGTFSLNKDIVIVAVLEAAGYEIVLDANVEADAEDPLFYGSDWESVKEFDLTDNKELPTNLYRSGHKVTGWTMTLDADAPVYKEFNATLEAAATAAATGDVPEKLKLYAHWEASSETAMTVKSANSAEEGSLKIFQAVEGNNTTPMVVPAEGLVVPVGLNDVQLVAVFSPAEDFTLTDDFYMFVKADGADSAALEKVADGAAFALARNVSIMAPVIQKNYKFAFDVNAGDANVFYDNALPETATYNVDAEEADRVLPTGIYRAGKTLDGWALSANATSGVKVFDAAFVSKVLASDAPDAAGVRTLYAVWTASTEEPIVVTVDVENASSGTMKLYQVLGDAAADKVELALVNNQVSVPAVAGMKISADFTLADNFEFTDATPIVVTAASATADDEPAVYANGSAFEVTENVTISVNVKTDRPTFAFDANANGGMVYYVGDKVSSVTYDIADGETALPANLYQVGSKLVGWSFDQNAETGMVNFDNDFIAAYNAATTEEDGAPTKLYAVWSEVKVPTVVIKNADTEKGTLNVIPYGYTEWMPVPADGLEIPMVDGGLSFEVKFAAAEGYAMAADLVAYDQMGKEMAGYIVDGVMTVAENVVIKGVDAVNDYSIKFVVATTDNDIYFASDWESAGEFNVTDKSTLPNNVARSGYVLAGWALTPDAESGIMTLTGDFAKDLSAEEENSLYPVWEANEASVYVIASNNLEAGTLTLSQTVEGNTYDHEVPAEGLKVPAIKNLVLDVSFATSVGYSLNATSAFYTVDAEGNALAALKSGTLTVDGDAIIQAPVFAETYEFAFRVNSGDQRVFYGRTWFEDKSYDLTMEEADRKFSGDIYRTDSCFVGWTFEENGTEYFNEFNAAFLNAAVEYNVAPGVLKDLYAVWSEDCGEQKNVTVKLANADAGIITLTQSVSKTSWNVDLDETGLEIPAVKGIDFTVAIEINAGYTADGDWAYYMIVDEKQELVGDKFVVEPSLPEVMLLNVPAVEDPSVEFAFDANAGSANVFYGADWRASGSFYLGCDIPEFPKDVYRTDSVWKGWAFTANGSETFTKFDISFIKAMRAAKDLGLNTKTLYAIWTAPEVEIETVDVSVSFKNASSGKITLSQMVDEYNEVKTEYDLTSGQKLAVPVVEGGLVFNANATTTDGFDLEGDYPIVLMDAQGVELDSIANDGTVTISAATNVAVKVYAPDEYIFLDVNVAADVNLFFDSDWVDYVIADVDSNNALPMNLYRGDAVLAGWALTADASVSDAVQEFSADMLKKMVEQNEYKLYAVWKSGNDNIYVVTNTDADKGSMTLTRMVGDDSYEYEVPSAGLKIPAEVANDLYVPAFTLTAIGYEWNDGAYKAVVGTEETAIPEAGFKIESDVAIAAPISQLGFEIVFDSYIPDDRVFFGKNWTNRAIDMTFDVGFASKFPMDIYRVGYCLEGWTINPNATEDEPVFTEFSEDFVKAALETYADDYAGKVYTKWAACENETYRISADAGTVGYIELTQYGELDSEGNPIWIDFYRLTGDDDALIVPKGNGDISFTIEYTTSDGYSKDDPYLTYVYNASGRLLTSLSETESYVFTSDAKLKAGVSADHFTIVFDVNAADGAPVFYNDLWRASGEFDLDMDYADLEFPMAFRAGLRLAGWALEKAPAANADYYDVFTPELAKTLASGKAENVTLYAVWENDQYQESARITVADMEKGSVTLENAGNKFEIDEYGLLVPAVENGIAFKASYSVALGYSAPVGASLTYELDGESMTVNNGILLVESADDITLEIPAEADEAMRFAFDVNANGANVFYADGWKFEGSFNMGGTNSVFPEGIYRTDAKFLGWALSAESRRYFNEFDSEFIEAVKSMKDLGMKAEVLYAVWDTYALVETVRLTSGSEESGYFTVFQTVGGENFYYEVGAEGLEVPATETGLTFKASFETRPGYTIASQMPIIVESSETSQIENGGEFKAVANTVLDADANADQYRFAFNVNAGDANVFYGDSWSSTGEYSMATHEEFPRVIYQSNRVLVGWSLDSAGEELYNGMNEDLVTKLSDKVTTLYAVWEDSEVETYKVSFANTEVGDLKLVQIVENDTIAYEVGDDGLDVPVIDGGFRFKVAFMAGADYTNLVDADELFSVDENGEETAIEDEQIVVEKDLTIGIPVALEVFTVVFDENTDRKNVFYGSDWVAGGKYSVNEEGKGKPLPQYIYTADACVAGWTFGSDTTVYSDFNVELANAFKAGKRGANGYELKAKWVDAATCVSGAYIPAYASVSLVSEHGTVEFVEKSSEGNELVHTFDKKGNMLLPLDFDGQKLILRSIADSSFVMDSLVLVRENGDAVESYTYVDGKRMDFNMQGKFTAYYSKSNKTDVEIVDLKLEQSGSMIRVSIVTSEFEVTRNVEARVVVMDALGNVVVEKVVADSIKQTPANLVWTSSEPLPIGEYVVFADLSEGDDVVSESRSFSVDGAIVALGKDKWQMISMAIVDTSAIIWDDDPKFFWWDEVGEPGEFWQYKEFTKHDEVVAERGYWYSSLEGRDLPLNMDVKPVTKDVTWDLDSLVSGWNLVANPYGWSVDLYNANKDKYAQFDEDAEVQFLRYDEEIENYAPVYVLKPYEAVWAAVKSHTTWTLKAEAEFASDVAKDFPEMDKEDISKDSTSVSVSKRKALAKANSKNKWSMQAVLSDNNGRKDFWNILGVSDRPFVSAEPPAPMGDHVSLSVLEGKKAFAKSFKKVADSYEWQISMAASSDRFGYLSLEGVAGVKSLGYHVYVTIDGKTTEVLDGDQIRVALKAKATTATINVTEGRLNTVVASINGLRMTQGAGKVNVGFNVDDGLAGSRTVVDIVNLDGKVMATYSTKAEAGYNLLHLDAPKSGLYMLRVRVASQQVAGKIMVR